MASLTKDIWERRGRGYDSLGAHAYASLVSLAFAWTIVLVGASAAFSFGQPFSWLLLIGTFVASIIGIIIFTASKAWPVSLLGVSILSVALGVMIGPVVARYSYDVVINALLTTAGVTVLMSVLGIAIPRSMEGLGGYLIGGLMLLIIGNCARIFLPFFGISGDPLGILDWIGAGIFTIYIMYDWNKAMHLPHTVDNAVDAAGALILDVVNLFLYLLRLFSGSDD